MGHCFEAGWSVFSARIPFRLKFRKQIAVNATNDAQLSVMRKNGEHFYFEGGGVG